jgi:hypothetical protein
MSSWIPAKPASRRTCQPRAVAMAPLACHSHAMPLYKSRPLQSLLSAVARSKDGRLPSRHVSVPLCCQDNGRPFISFSTKLVVGCDEGTAWVKRGVARHSAPQPQRSGHIFVRAHWSSRANGARALNSHPHVKAGVDGLIVSELTITFPCEATCAIHVAHYKACPILVSSAPSVRNFSDFRTLGI